MNGLTFLRLSVGNVNHKSHSVNDRFNQSIDVHNSRRTLNVKFSLIALKQID